MKPSERFGRNDTSLVCGRGELLRFAAFGSE